MESIKDIRLGQINPSPFNPRKKKNPETVRELAESIKAVGLIQPLTVRLEFHSKEDDICPKYEVVCGHRRFEAAKMAGLESVPCIVRNLTVQQARELAITENLQRENVDIFDESDAFMYLMKEAKFSVKDIALKFGKSESYVYGRLRLQKIDGLFRELYDAGELPPSHALFISMLDGDVQKSLYGEHFAQNVASWASLRDCALKALKDAVLRESTELANARFDTSKCAGCTANTAYGEIFPGETKARCMNRKCFEESRESYLVEKVSLCAGGFFIDENGRYGGNVRMFDTVKALPGVRAVNMWEYDIEKVDYDDGRANGYCFYWSSFAIFRERVKTEAERYSGPSLPELCRSRGRDIAVRTNSIFEEAIERLPLDAVADAMGDEEDVDRLILAETLSGTYGFDRFGLKSGRGDNLSIINGMTKKQIRAAMLIISTTDFDDDGPAFGILSRMFPDLLKEASEAARAEVDGKIREKCETDLTDDDLEALVASEIAKVREDEDMEEGEDGEDGGER